jgi:hypothetical protein
MMNLKLDLFWFLICMSVILLSPSVSSSLDVHSNPISPSRASRASRHNRRKTPTMSWSAQCEVAHVLYYAGLSQYTDIIVDEGFDDLETLRDMTENDMVQLGISSPHRKTLRSVTERLWNDGAVAASSCSKSSHSRKNTLKQHGNAICTTRPLMHMAVNTSFTNALRVKSPQKEIFKR